AAIQTQDGCRAVQRSRRINTTDVVTRVDTSTSRSLAAPPARKDRRISNVATGAMLGNRQCHVKRGAAAWRRCDVDAAVVGHDDLLHQRETETGAGLLGREERTEDLLASLGRDPWTVVTDGHTDDAAVDRPFHVH